jgi:NADPH-dependent 2,4-dienoyl-CoA reductase/sulfur reductase-like enzyme
MAEVQSYVIIGNGIAGLTAAELLRTEDAAAPIVVIADDHLPVYYRPALKDYLGGKIGEEKLWARPLSYYLERRIRFLTDRVVGIQVQPHTVSLRNGTVLGYSRLLLATGARARSINCSGAHLVGVTTLRTVADYQKVIAYLSQVRRVVVVGSGTLALETCETLRHRGYAVTHLLRRRRLWSEVLDATASDLVLQQEVRDGVDVRYEQEIAEIYEKEGHVSGIITTDGTHIPCELVLLCIGIEPQMEVAKSAGIACGVGVKVNAAMQTSAPDIYAAGDLIETTDPITGRSRVIGQWYPAIQQARAVAYSMLDLLDTNQHYHFGNFYNATFLYGLPFASVGLSTLPAQSMASGQYQEIIAEPQPRTYQKVILKQGVPLGMLALGDRTSSLAWKRAIDHHVNLSPVVARLFAPDFKLDQWLDQQGVPPALLNVSREGASAVKQVAYAAAKVPSGALSSATITEAILVPAAPAEIATSMQAIYLSQTKVITIGRQEGVDLSFQHSSISRRHAEISYANGQYVLRDLGSTNGTFLNGKRVEPGSVHRLNANDSLRFGHVLCVFRLREVDPASSVLLGSHKQPAQREELPSAGPEEKQARRRNRYART